MANSVYAGAVKKPVDEAIIRRFVRECPPFYAVMIALCAKRYDCYLKPQNAASLRAGAADTFMAICLPYCNEFVTADCGQLRCFREVVAFIGLDVTLKSYEEFRRLSPP